MSAEEKAVLSGQRFVDQTPEVSTKEQTWMQTLSQANDMRVAVLQRQLFARMKEDERLKSKYTQLEKENTRLEQKQARLKKKFAELEAIVDVDPLTGAYSRRYLGGTAQKMIANEIRAQRSWGILMIDIDYFKKCNDRHGHDAGDKVLKNVVKMMQHVSRKGDFVIRYGGEEFCILIFDIDADELEVIAERYRKAVASTDTPIGKYGYKKSVSVTVSIGACFVPSDSVMELKSAVVLADNALYEAKKSGRNYVSFHDRRKAKNNVEGNVASDRRDSR